LLSPHILLVQLYHTVSFNSKAVGELEYVLSAEPKIISDEVMAIKQYAKHMLSAITQ